MGAHLNHFLQKHNNNDDDDDDDDGQQTTRVLPTICFFYLGPAVRLVVLEFEVNIGLDNVGDTFDRSTTKRTAKKKLLGQVMKTEIHVQT